MVCTFKNFSGSGLEVEARIVLVFLTSFIDVCDSGCWGSLPRVGLLYGGRILAACRLIAGYTFHLKSNVMCHSRNEGGRRHPNLTRLLATEVVICPVIGTVGGRPAAIRFAKSLSASTSIGTSFWRSTSSSLASIMFSFDVFATFHDRNRRHQTKQYSSVQQQTADSDSCRDTPVNFPLFPLMW